MSSESRKATAFALGSSLEMLVLILMTFVTTAAGEPKSCDEYCALLLSGKIGRTWSGICNCHPQSEDKELDSTRRNLDSNSIYYEPVEFHPLPEVSFVYQPFVISNPTLNHKASATNEANQESEHHKKYKRKHDIIHKISIDTDRQPLYLDIDIKNSPSQSRSSENHMIEVDNLHKTEQDLKDCIDLHLLVHFRRNGSGEIPDVENLKKYFHISDADLITELNDRCNKPSNVVEQSLRQIKEKSKSLVFNSSGTEYLKPITIDNSASIQSNINYRAAFSESKLKHNIKKTLLNTTALKEDNLVVKTERNEISESNDNETAYTTRFDDIVANAGEFLTKTSNFTSIISNYTNKNSNNNDMSIKMRDHVTSTTDISLTSTDIITSGSILSNDLGIDATTLENDSKSVHNILEERDVFGKLNEDQEKSSNNARYTLIKNRSAYELPSISNTQYGLNETTKELYKTENSERNIHDSSIQTADTRLVNKLTLGRDLLEADLTEKSNTDSTYTSLFTSTTEQSHFVETYENRKLITENKIQIPKIVVTEYSNDTVGSTVDGIEKLPNNDYMPTDFDLDVLDLTIGGVTSPSYKDNKSKQDENKKTLSDLDLVIDENNHGKNAENSHSNEISGKIYFMFRKHLIPMRFVQALDGKLNLSIDGESFCDNLLIDGKKSGIISTLCNFAVFNNNNCT